LLLYDQSKKMIHQSLFIFFLFTFYISLGNTCVPKCISQLKDASVIDCLKIYNQGKILKNCSIKRMKTQCRVQCEKGNPCTEDCQETLCGTEKRTVCKKVCHNKGSKDCRENCTWKNEISCILDRFPGKWFAKCQWIISDGKFKTCFSGCAKKVPPKTCIGECSKVFVPKEFKGCLNSINKNNIDKCSAVENSKLCKEECKRKRCYLETQESLCNGKKKILEHQVGCVQLVNNVKKDVYGINKNNVIWEKQKTLKNVMESLVLRNLKFVLKNVSQSLSKPIKNLFPALSPQSSQFKVKI